MSVADPHTDTSDDGKEAATPDAEAGESTESEQGIEAHAALTLDRVVHEPARLAILAVLSGAQEVDFAFLQAATGLTKGNLSRQTSKLEEVGYIAIRKYFKGKIPATGYRITPTGRDALARYTERIMAISQQVQAPAEQSSQGDQTPADEDKR